MAVSFYSCMHTLSTTTGRPSTTTFAWHVNPEGPSDRNSALSQHVGLMLMTG